MTAEQAEVVSEDVAVERFTELSAERASTDTAGQTAENGARYGTKSDADRPGDSTERCASLTTCKGSADATRNTAHGADGRTDFHCVVEGSDFGGVTARALQ